ncbi:hypothetical protein LSCM1_05965 [Leishmania martiniquensis]|uniref:Serine/threonine specific protein phosphatases domain-containing protein n=1 Tax=Leishmania martiniquensis TaxID=1580590 RepID=A0A836HHA2_9TRYP|nr:hypothetical protein LSCM1_05965 [Leishmania martiniquensis]
MPNASYGSTAGRTRPPLSASTSTNAYAARPPFASTALHYDGDSCANRQSIFEAYSVGSDAVPTSAAEGATVSPSLFLSSSHTGVRSRSRGSREGDQHVSTGASESPPPAHEVLSSPRPDARASQPSAVERITRWLCALLPTPPPPHSATAAAHDRPRASSVEGASASVDEEDETTPASAENSSNHDGDVKWSTIKCRMTMQPPYTQVASHDITETSSTATLVSRQPCAAEIHEPFYDYPATMPWKQPLCKSAPSGPSSLEVVADLPTCVADHARTVTTLSSTLCSGRSQTREQLISSSSPSALGAGVAGAAFSTSPRGPAAVGTRRKRPLFFFHNAPQSGEFVPLIEWLLHRGKCGDIDAPAVSQRADGEYTQASFFNEDYIMKLCAAATEVLVKEPTLLELEVLAHDTLVVVGDIHGQFQDLYTSVLCQQYDRRRCNTDGRDRRFLFMGDYVDRGPHSLEVVLLLLALKVEYPTLVYLTRGNHEEEKTSRVYGFLTEATASLGAAAGAAVWTAVNRVFLDLPLAAVVHTLHMRFFVAHGGLSPGLEKVDEICALERRNYSCGNITAAEDDIITGLLWSDPTSEVDSYKRNPRGCGFLFGPSASLSFCTSNNFDFICRAHQVAMDGYFWTHNDRVVTVFSAPNYCGVNGNKGALLLVKGRAGRPIIEQFDCIEKGEEVPARKTDFVHAEMFT